MGKFQYDGLAEVEFEDRTLAHLQIVIGAKLRRGESFAFTWREDPSTGNGRTTVWVHPKCLLAYRYFGAREPKINRAWVEALMLAANSTSGLYVVAEPSESAHVVMSTE